MTTQSDEAHRRRSVEAEIEVPGTPEQVWEAIATGPGISAWFVPTEVGERHGGEIAQHHGADMDQTGTVTAWEPPHRFAWETEWQPTPAASLERTAVEFLVEARAGGSCVVRVVNSGFGSGADWDRAVESIRQGWPSALDNLRLYLTYFPGQHAASFAAGHEATGTADDAWRALAGAVGLGEALAGERLTAQADAPRLAGTVERVDERQLVLRIDEPGTGFAFLGAGAPGERPYAFVRAYLYGDDAPTLAARAGTDWQAWLDRRFSSSSR